MAILRKQKTGNFTIVNNYFINDPNLKVGGILLTMVDGRTNLSKDISRELKETYGTVFKLFDSTIPRAVKVAETTRLGESILSYDKNSKIAESYKNFAKEVINFLDLKE